MFFKKSVVKNFLRFFLVFAMLSIGINNVSANFFPCGEYTLPLGKCLAASPYRTFHGNISWSSSNNNVANVDRYGVVYSKSVGNAEINANVNGCVHKFKLKVTDAEPVRSVYTNLPKENENLTVYAVTPKKATKVKFEVNGQNFRKEAYTSSKTSIGNYYLWEATFQPVSKGVYNLVAFSDIDGTLRACPDSNIKFTVSSNSNNSFNSNCDIKHLSREGINFIARKEGFSSKFYLDLAGFLTIAHGKVIRPYNTFYNDYSRKEAYQDLLNQVNNYGFSSSVNNFLAGNGIKYNQCQFDALVSFTYNLGKGWINNSSLKNIILNVGCTNGYGVVNSDNGLVLRRSPNIRSRRICAMRNNETVTLLNRNKVSGNWYNVKTSSGRVGYCYADYLRVNTSTDKSLNSINRSDFIREFLCYHHIGKKCYRGLFNRRAQELEVFFNGNYNCANAANKYPKSSCCLR